MLHFNKLNAIKILGLSEKKEITLKELKESYRELCKKFHPDKNPSGKEMMQVINNAYDQLKDEKFPLIIGEFEKTSGKNYSDEINAVLNKVADIHGITIEVIGNWIWLHGAKEVFTQHKEILKTPIIEGEKRSRFYFSASKKAWYYSPFTVNNARRRYTGDASFQKMRSRYGSTIHSPSKKHYVHAIS
jgi:curved DNA-binding protein CbpA